MSETTKVGIIACSGEEIAAGTISRLATRRVLELLRPQTTVTLCLPLFLAGEEQERRFARQHPTITVDGCEKLCAKRGTEQYSGQVAASLVVSDILGDRVATCHRSARDFDRSDEEAVWLLAERIAVEVDTLSAAHSTTDADADRTASACGCACGGQPAQGNLRLDGKTVTVNGLPLIFDQLFRMGVVPDDNQADRLLNAVRVYHAIEAHEDDWYRNAVAQAYTSYYRGRTQPDVPADALLGN